MNTRELGRRLGFLRPIAILVLLLLQLVLFAACQPSPSRQEGPNRTAAGFDATTYPWLADAIRAQRPHLLATRGGRPPRIIINDAPQALPLEILETIPTRDVVRIERRHTDVTQVGSVGTLRITIRVGLQ